MFKINSNNKNFSELLNIYIKNAFKCDNLPVILCIGSDRAIGDALAPLIGTFLSEELNIKTYVYGTLHNTINAKNIENVYKNIKKLHPNRKILCIDACLGDFSDIGFVKMSEGKLFPGSALKKSLGGYGDYSILGIIGEYSENKFSIFKTRLKEVYEMSRKISFALKKALG